MILTSGGRFGGYGFYLLKGKPVFSVQHHPEASPGPQDSHYLFRRFADYMEQAKR